MKKRLRKKLHRGEFNWKCFEVTCSFEPKLSEEEIVAFVDSFIGMVESRNLGCGGSTTEFDTRMHVSKALPTRTKIRGMTRHKGAHCTEEDRTAVSEWLRNRPFVTTVQISPLEGGWY